MLECKVFSGLFNKPKKVTVDPPWSGPITRPDDDIQIAPPPIIPIPAPQPIPTPMPAPQPVPIPSTPQGIRTMRIANEYQSFAVNSTQAVRYGINDSWVTKTIEANGECTNNFFGSDPAPGIAKVCEVFLTGDTNVTPPIATIGRSRDPSSYTWESPITVNATWLSANGYGSGTGDVVIQNRSFKSTNPTIAAVTVDTPRRVILQSCNLSAFQSNAGGVAGGCVKAVYQSQKIHMLNCLCWGGIVNPMQAQAYAGRVLTAQGIKEVVVRNCEAYGTSGIQIQEFLGDRTGASTTISIKNNKFVEIDGRISDPTNAASGYYRENNTWNGAGTMDFTIANLVQFNAVKGVPNVEVSNNEVICTANKSRFEDIVSFYLTYGTAASPMRIQNNIFRGGYVFDRWFNPATSTYFGNNMPIGTKDRIDDRGFANSGGGGLLGDGKALVYTDDPAFLIFEDNLVLDMSNYGIGIASGHDMTLKNNKVFRSGLVHSVTRDVKIAWGHVALQVQDYYLKPSDNYVYTAAQWSSGQGAAIDDGTGTSTNRVRWYNNDMINNTYGHIFRRVDGSIGLAGLAINSPLRTNTGNVDILAGLTSAQATALLTKGYTDNLVVDKRTQWTNAGIVVGLEA